MSNSRNEAAKAAALPGLTADAVRADLHAIRSSVFQSFARDRRGSTGIIFGLLIAPLMLTIGMAVDYSRTISIRNKTQLALDGAALAATSVALKNPTNPNLTADAAAAASAYFAAARPVGVSGTPVLTQSNTSSTTQFTASLNSQSYIKTPFLSFAGALNPSLASITDANAPADCRTGPLVCMPIANVSNSYAALNGGNAGYNIEVSMMIDITGSMDEAAGGGQTKLQAVKVAANAAIDKLIWTDQSVHTSKIAIVPFTEGVRLPIASNSSSVATVSSYQLATGALPLTIGTTCKSSNGGACGGGGGGGWGWGGGGGSSYYQSGCVVERTGTNKYTEVAPSAGNYYMVQYAPGSSGQDNCALSTSAVIQPLTSTKSVLHTLVNSFNAGGSTAGQTGTQWAWNVLSPNFNTLWPTASQAVAYSEVTNGHTKKIAILMTDGDYNTEYDVNGIDDYYSGASPANDTSTIQAGTLCTNMKAAGIEVYTIAAGTGMSQASRNFLLSCATDATHNYNATDSTSILAAYNAIATRIAAPRLTN